MDRYLKLFICLLPVAILAGAGIRSAGDYDVPGDVNMHGDESMLVFTNRDSNGISGRISFRASSSLVSDVNFVLPIADGNASDVLTTDGNGNLSWSDANGVGGGAESDPIFSASDVNDVNSTDIAHWNYVYDNNDTAAGSDGQIQYNNGGVFGGDSNLAWDDVNNILTIIGDVNASNLNITNWDTAYTHSQDNTQAHSDYMLNTGDTATGDYNFGGGLFWIDDTNNAIGINTTSPQYKLHIEENTVSGNYPITYMSTSQDRPLFRLKSTSAGANNYFMFDLEGDNAGDKAFGTTITGNSFGSFIFYLDGKIEWGPGSAARDTNLYRTAANSLKTDDTFTAANLVSSDDIIAADNIGSEGVTPEGCIHAYTVSGIGSTMKTERGNVNSDVVWTSMRLLSDKTSNMGDGFGPAFVLYIEDDADVENQIAYYGAIRAGADNSGSATIATANSGSVSVKLTVEPDGSIVAPAIYSEDLAGTSPRTVVVKSDGTLGYDSSSIRFKENVRDLNDVSWIYDIKPRVYDRKNGLQNNEVGLIAEELEAIAGHSPELISYKVNRIETPNPNSEFGSPKVTYELTDEPETVNYHRLVVPLLKVVQDQQKRIEELEKRIEILEESIADREN